MGKSVKLLLKNSIRNTFSSLSQLFGMIILVTMLALVITSMTAINTRVLNRYSDLVSKSNQHNVVLQLDPTENSVNQANELGYDTSNNVEAQQYLMENLQKYTTENNPNLDFDWTRTEGRDFSQTYNEDGKQMTVKAVTKTTIGQNSSVDDVVLSEGRMPSLVNQNSQSYLGWHEIVLDTTFAKLNNIKIGTIVRFQLDDYGSQFLVASDKNSGMTDKLKQDLQTIQNEGIATVGGLFDRQYKNNNWFQVVGLGQSADFITPVLNQQGILPNRDTEALVYVAPKAFGLELNNDETAYKFSIADSHLQVSSNTEWESYYSIKTKNGQTPSQSDINWLDEYFRDKVMQNKDTTRQYIYAIGDSNYRYNSRTSMIESTIKYYDILIGCILIVVLGVSLYVMALITKKQIEKSRGQIGVMKALGYRKRDIIISFTTTPLFTSIIGGVIGFLLSIGVQQGLINRMSLYFSLDFASFSFDWIGFLVAVVLMWFILTFIAFLIAWSILRKSALNLIGANKKPKIDGIGLVIKKMNVRNSFGSKMRNALLIDARGKMSGVAGVVLLSTILMTFSFMAPDILNKYKTKSYNGINYNQLVEYAEPIANNPYSFMKTYNKNSTLNTNGDVSSVYDENGNKIKGYSYSDILKGITALPTTSDGHYDMDAIIKAYINGDASSEFYTPFIRADSSDGPTPAQISYACSKMLAATNMTLTNTFMSYLATISKPITVTNSIFNIANNSIWAQLSDQWIDRKQFVSNVEANKNDKLTVFNLMQKFYLKYIDSIGLSITNFSSYTEDEQSRIITFNHSSEYQNTALDMFKNDLWSTENGIIPTKGTTFEEIIDSLDSNIVNNTSIYLLNGDNGTKKYALKDEDGFDFSTYVATDESDTNIQKGIVMFAKWYGSLFAQRTDAAIIQSGWSRAPYFVKQYMQQAFEDSNYTESFNIINYDANNEQLGTFMNASTNNLSFKIYGIDSTNTLMNLFDENGNSLNSLIETEDSNNIIINQTVAQRLGLQTGDEVTLDISQDMLEYNGQQVSMENWSDSGQRDSMSAGFAGITPELGPTPTNGNGFIQQASMNPLNSKFTDSNNNDVKIYDDSQFALGTVTTPLTNAYRSGQASMEKVTNKITFTVAGIHDGYGTATAWINNDAANRILGYNDAQNYLWENQFLPQFGGVDGDEFFQGENTQNHSELIKLEDQTLNNGKKISEIMSQSYSDFKYVMIDHWEAFGVSEQNHNAALNIQKLFKSTNPIFNYKYSKDTNVGDLNALISVWTPTGDYNPTSMNGDGVSIDGIAQSSFGTVVPIQTSKQILETISEVIMAILILIITLVLVLTFVIILLTTSLIISDNSKFIATMKVLGYSNRYIAKNVLGMYMIVIVITFAIGFASAFCGIYYGVHSLARTSLVLPISFVPWILPAVAAAIIGIYIVTITVGFRSISRLNATRVLQSQNI